MTVSEKLAASRLESLVDLLEIPPSYYDLATKRYESLSSWLGSESALKELLPSLYPQGSFRLGTVIRPFLRGEEYDLDLVCELTARTKRDVRPSDVKRDTGDAVKAYARAMQIEDPVEEKPRCWRLDYADTVKFHMDILPAVPNDSEFKRWLVSLKNVDPEWAEYAIAITDNTHADFNKLGGKWPASNPKGYAKWFETRMIGAARVRLEALVAAKTYASVEEVPAYQWKTPLQRAIQLLKRHRDVMFKDEPDLKPISIIITTLAAKAYEGELELWRAVTELAHKMPEFVEKRQPRVANPVNPDEDFAEKWNTNPRLEDSFWTWQQQLSVDLERLQEDFSAKELIAFAEKKFGLELAERSAQSLAYEDPTRIQAAAGAPAVVISAPPRPWSDDAR